MGELSLGLTNSKIAEIKTEWNTTAGALVGIAMGTPKPAYRVVGTIGTGADTVSLSPFVYVTSLNVSTFYDPSISEIPLVCSIYITFHALYSDYE